MNMAFALVSKVTYARDALGRVTGVSTKINAAASPVTVASGVTYALFGPLTPRSLINLDPFKLEVAVVLPSLHPVLPVR